MLLAKRLIACLGIQLFFLTIVVAQQDVVLKNIHQKFEEHNSYFQEKIFVHADRDFYVAGETMWFKLYVVDGRSHKASDISKVAYVEMLDKEQKAVLQAKIKLEEGLGKGSFYLPLSLQSGTYKIRAYTGWMRNFDAEYYFEKPLTIVNTFLTPEEKPKTEAGAYDIQFFPEGGNLVVGVRSKIAFRAVGKEGKGVDFKGVIIAPEGDTVAQFQPLKFGIGHFYLTPTASTNYTAIIKVGKDNIAIPLPAVQDTGYVLHVTDHNSGKLEVSVVSGNSSESLPVYMLVQTRKEVKVAKAQKLQNGKTVFSIDKAALGDGISHITVFNHKQQPVAERLYFKYPQQNISIQATTDKELYFPRQKVNLDLLTMVGNEPVEADLSVAVYKLDSLNTESSANILSYLWLSSDLKGTIESPAYYFKQDESEVAEAMDNLILTHGWRRFKWEDVLQDRKPQFRFIPEYEGHLVKGVVREKNNNAPVEGVKTYLSIPGKLVQFYASQSNEKGEFLFVTENLYGPKEMILQTNTADSLYQFTLEDPFSKEYSSRSFPDFSLSPDKENLLRDRHIQMQAQNIYWEEQRNKFLAPELDSMSFWGPSDKVYLLDDYTRFPTMEEVMREYVYEVRVRKDEGNFRFMVFNPETETFYSNNPLVLLDGVPVFDINKIIEFNPLIVESLEVFQGKYSLGGNIVFPGIVSYSTYKGDLADFPLDPDLLKVAYEGLQFQREFFHPVYEQDREKNSRMPDFRSLLYWSPDVKTGDSGKYTLSFYTSDIPGEYVIVVQGISNEGSAGYNSIAFKVESSL